MNIDNDSIFLMNQTITIDDMVENLYYKTDIALSKNQTAIKLLYINNLTEIDRHYFYYLINAKISETSKIANINKPIFKFIDILNNQSNTEYFLDIEDNMNDNKNNYFIEYKTTNKCNYKINIYQTEDDKYKFNFRDWNWHISYLDPFYSTLKFKIKEEKITRKIRNDFNNYKKTNDNNYLKLSNDLNDLKYYIYNNDMNIKYYIIILYILIFIDIFYK